MTTSSIPLEAPRGSRVAWIYRGVWGVLARGFLVPQEPPVLPSVTGEPVRSFRPAPNFLRYLLWPAWITYGFVALPAFFACVGFLIYDWRIGLPVTLVVGCGLWFLAALMVLAIYLRYDTTWYVLSDRSLRIRRGLWIIRETTITFENIQNVSVNQGPLQRLFGIADVLVQTAGGGGAVGPHGQAGASTHHGVLEGMTDAQALRDLLTSKMRASKSAGLGDEAHEHGPAAGWTPEHLAALREIRAAALALA